MTSELEKMANEIARKDSDFYEGIFVGAKAVLEFARNNSERGLYTLSTRITIEDLEKFVEGEK